MSNAVTNTWLDKVRRYRDRYCAYREEVGMSAVPPGATDDDIQAMKRAAMQRGLHVDAEYVAFLRIVNGASYEGVSLYGANISGDDGRRDFIRDNDAPWHDDLNTTRYGKSDIDIYQFNANNSRFEVIDNGGGDVMESFATFGELADYAVSKVLAHGEPPAYSDN